MEKSEKLTQQERAFAEKYHNLIYSFLNENRLQVDEFYDIAAIGFLRAVRRYHREPKLKKYSFTTIAWQAMRSSVGNKRKSDRIRDAIIAFSINDLTDDGTEYGEFIQDAKDGFLELEQKENMQELLANIMPALNERQRNHIVAALEGYCPQEIMQKQRISVQNYHEDRKAIQRATADALPTFFCGGGVLYEIRIRRRWQQYGKIPA